MRQLDLFGVPVIKEEEAKVSTVKPAPALNDRKPPPEKIERPVFEMDPVEETVEKAFFEIAAVEEKIEEPSPKDTIQKSREKVASKRGRKSFKDMDAEVIHVEVPEDEILFRKQYYSISEVAQWFNVNTSLLRFWENEFDVLKPRKTRKGDRLFRPEDVKNLQLIYYLLRQRKFSIEGAKQYLKENKKKADVQMQLMQSLTKFRAFLLEWKANLGA